MQPKLILRDLCVWALMFALLWAEGRALAGEAPRGLALALGVGAGVLVGLCGHYLHEWGHLLGSLVSGSAVRYPTRLTAPLLFDFVVSENTRRQFLVMSLGGYAGSVIGIALIATCLPLDRLSGQLSLGLAVIGALASLVLEGPTTWRVMRGGEPPPALLDVADD